MLSKRVGVVLQRGGGVKMTNKGEMLYFVITSVVTSYLLIRGIINLFSDPITGVTMLVLAVLLVFSTANKKIRRY